MGTFPAAFVSIDRELFRAGVSRRLFEVDAPGPTVARYQLVERLGGGGQGAVYRALDPALDRQVAIKLIPLGSDASTDRVVREGRRLASLQHVNVVPIFDVGTWRHGAYIVMELVRGRDLQQWLAERHRSCAEILDKFGQAGHALAAVHSAGVVHGDFKAHNAMVDEGGHVRLIDFGSGITRLFASPEQRQGLSVTPRSDQYSFCVALRLALDGRGSRRVVAALRRGTSDTPSDRFEDMPALLRRIEPPRRRRAWAVGGAVAAGLALATFGQKAPVTGGPCDSMPRPDLVAHGWDRSAVDDRLHSELRRWITEWRTVHAHACAPPEPPHAVPIRQCLRSGSVQLSTLVSRWASSPPDVAHGLDALAGVPAPSSCLHVAGPARPPEDAELRDQLDRASGLLLDGAFAEASTLTAEVAAVASGSLAGDAAFVAGRAAGLLGQRAEADEAFAEAAWLGELHGRPELTVSAASEQINMLASWELDPEAARPWVRRGDDALRRMSGHPRLRADYACSVAKLRLRTGETAPARDCVAKTVAAFGAQSGKTAAAHNVLAVALESEGQWAGASESYARALDVAQAAYGDDHYRLVAILNNWGSGAARHGEAEVAIDLLTRAGAILQDTPELDDTATVRVLMNLATARAGAGHLTQALADLDLARQQAEDSSGDHHPILAEVLIEQTRVLLELSRAPQARAVLERARAIAQATLPPGDALLVEVERVAEQLESG